MIILTFINRSQVTTALCSLVHPERRGVNDGTSYHTSNDIGE